ncbi:GNAT family N-acetyltransferase [Vibrio alfacsensis]|uniref:GNAT family N-acetyltransferase n=1 Tax=Vibrio alfacsensis TaxID=1074311 RepID=UPI0040677F58
MKTQHSNLIQCEIYKTPSRVWLENTWRNLEERSNQGFFLSWTWIGTWLECFVDEFILVEARKGATVVGIGIFVKQTEKMSAIPIKTKYYLHRTGIQQQDQIWIEYNDFLMDSLHEEATREAMIESFAYWIDKREAIVIGASDGTKFDHVEMLGLRKRTLWETNNYALHLDELRSKQQSVLQFLSRNSRYQISRSMRKYSELGDITVEKASDVGQAKGMLAIAKPFHLARWNQERARSGFANPDFELFHERLIRKGLQDGFVELYHIKVGSETLSIMYNFKYDNHIYFYLCAINYTLKGAQYKPGLISHYLLINKALEEGATSYDFMGGTARYKDTFSNTKGRLSVNQYEHPSSLLKFESAVRRTKSWWTSEKR